MLCWSWTTISLLLLLLLASINCSSPTSGNNYLAKIIIEKHGQKFINLYALPQVTITLETTKAEDFKFKMIRYAPIMPVKLTFSTDSSLTDVICDAADTLLECETTTSPPKTVYLVAGLHMLHSMNLYASFEWGNLSFLKDGSKYLLKMSSKFTPLAAVDNVIYPFLMEWPSSVIVQEPSPHELSPTEATVTIPPNYKVCEGSEDCESLKDELDVKFAKNGSLEFLFGFITKEKEYEVVHSFDEYSPIYTLAGTSSCSVYTVKVSFGEVGYILFDRKGEKIEIKSSFEPLAQTEPHASNPIKIDSPVHFYFYKNVIFCSFFDPQDHFRMRTLVLPEGTTEKLEISRKIQLNSSGIIPECRIFNKLVIAGNNVKLLLPKLIETTSTLPPSLPTEYQTTPQVVAKKDEDSSEASLPLYGTILLSCIGGLLLLCAIIFVIYCCIKQHKKRKQPKTPDTAMLEPSMPMRELNDIFPLGKKSNDDNIPIIIGATTASLAGKDDGNVLPKKDVKQDKKDAGAKKTDDENVLPKKDVKQDKKDAGTKKNTVDEEYDKIPAPKIIIPPPPPEFKPEVKAVRFDREWVRSVLPDKVFEMEKYYEENPIEDETIDWKMVPQKIQLPSNNSFWDLFPFLKAERPADIHPDNRKFQYQFIIRDLSLPENKVFHTLGARLAEPVVEELIEEKGVDVRKLKAVVIKTFILSHDPPTIEFIIHNNQKPGFFFSITECRSCPDEIIRYFTSTSDLSTCLRELPLGHHAFTAIGAERIKRYERKKTPNRKIVYVVKGGRQSVPVNLKFGAFAHRNQIHIGAAKKKQKRTTVAEGDDEQMVATLNSRENDKKTAAKKTKSADAATTRTAPTQDTADAAATIGTAPTQNTGDNYRDGTTAGTQQSVTERS